MREGLIYDAGVRAEALRQEAEAARLVDSMARARGRRVVAQTRSFRSCVYRFVQAYHRGTADTARTRENESYIDASVRTCGERFPDADYESALTPGFIDSLMTAGVSPP